MPHTRRITFTQYLIDQRKHYPHATGDFNALMHDVALACKAISRAVSFGKLADALEPADLAGVAMPARDTHGAEPKKVLSAVADGCFAEINSWGGHVAGMVSEDSEQPYQIPAERPRGKYLLLFDPLDGTSNIDVNGTVGSIFSVLRAPEDVVKSGRDVTAADFLQPGTEQVAAGYALYGPNTMLMMTVGRGVAGFTLDPNLGQFMLTHPDVRVPEDTDSFAINVGNARFWEPPVKRYVDECLAGKSGKRGKDFSMRYVASRVAEAHRILMHGGVFMHPRDTRDPAKPAKLRLLYEANPISFLIEQAGGRSTTGYEPTMNVKPKDIHQRIGLICGSRNEVELIEGYHTDKLQNVTLHSPLFGERGLFRD